MKITSVRASVKVTSIIVFVAALVAAIAWYLLQSPSLAPQDTQLAPESMATPSQIERELVVPTPQAVTVTPVPAAEPEA